MAWTWRWLDAVDVGFTWPPDLQLERTWQLHAGYGSKVDIPMGLSIQS